MEALEARLALTAELGELLTGSADGKLPMGPLSLAQLQDTTQTGSSAANEVSRSIVPGEIIIAFSGEHELAALRAELSNSLELARLDLTGNVSLEQLLTVGQESGTRQTLVSLQLGEFQDVLAAGKVLQSLAGVEWAQPNYAYGWDFAGSETAVGQARAYLLSQASSLGLDFPTLADLTHVFTRDLSFGSVERFQQHVEGIPVYEAEIAVTILESGDVGYVYNGYQSNLHLSNTVPIIAAVDARNTALLALNLTGNLSYDFTRLIVFPASDGAHLAYQVALVPMEGVIGDYEVVVDAGSGVILQSIDRTDNAVGTGSVFNPDPLTSSNSTYGASGYSDAADADSTQLTAQRQTVTLQDITLNAGIYSLVGPYAQIVDTESPLNGLFTQASSTFSFTRNNNAFEAVNAYYHLDRFLRYLNTTLGLNVHPTQYAGGVKFDPSGLSGGDNSHYTPSSGVLAFGEGGVDDAEDADVIIHELGHGIHDWVTGGGLSQVNGLSEGVGDYFAQSYSRAFGLWPTSNPAYHYTFSWDGHNEYWGGRTTNYSAVYPGGLVNQIHSDGQIWATANMKIWDVLGAAKTDAMMIEGLAMTGATTNQQQAAQAVLQAASNRGYTTTELNSIFSIYTATGYVVTLPTPPTQLRGAVWNDLNGNRNRDAGENGLSGWTVYLDANTNGTLDTASGNRASTDVPKTIADLSTATSQTVVTGLAGNITDLNVTLSLTHTYDSDLTLTLISPGSLRITLASGVGGASGGQNFTNTVFDQQAATLISSGTAPFTGTFRPQGSLSSLNGTVANGTWRLEIVDGVSGDSGTLTSWSLQFTTGEPSALTNGTGDYLLTGLTAGNYVVREVVQATWTQTLPVTGSHAVTLATQQTLANLDFANTQGNSVPLIADIPDQSVSEDSSVAANFTIADIETAAASLALSANTSNATLLPLGGIVFSGTAGNRTVTLTPAANQFGTATVTVIVTDGGAATAQDTLVLTVNPVNDPPSFTKGADQTVAFNAGPQTVANWATAISAGPNEVGQTVAFNVTTNTNAALFATLPAIAADGTLTYTPNTGVSGAATITITAQDTGGTANGGVDTSASQSFVVTVNPGVTSFQVSSLTATTTGVMLDFNRDLNPAPLNLYDLQGATFGPADVTLVGAVAGSIRGSVVVDPNLRRLTFIRTAGTLPADIYTLTLRSAADGFIDSTASLLDGDANGTAGGNYVQTFSVSTPPVNAVTLSVANFARGPQQAVNVPANGASGLPISFSDGNGITAANFQLRYNPALLNITGATVAPGLTGATVNINTSTPGSAVIQFSSPTPLVAGTTRFIDLQANVPTTAPYRTKHVLDISNIALNPGPSPIPAIDDDALHIAAYFGDTTGNGSYSSSDASRIARLAVGFDTGFDLYKLLDPLIIGDISGAGGISSTDTSRMLQAVVGFPVAEVPLLPLPAVSLIAGGPDPKLSIPTNLVATAGNELIVPVLIDSIVDLTGTGLESADLVIYYDPAVLDVTSASLGSLVANRGHWLIASRIDESAGLIFVSLAGNVPLVGFFQGELVQLHAAVRATAAPGPTALNLAASAPNTASYTQLNEGYLTLIPAPTNGASDPGVDGLLTIIASPPVPMGPTPLGPRANDLALLQIVTEGSARHATIAEFEPLQRLARPRRR